MLTSVKDNKGEVILYDCWANGQWIGSARTLPHAIQRLKNADWPSWIIADGDDYEIEHGSPHRIHFTDAKPRLSD